MLRFLFVAFIFTASAALPILEWKVESPGSPLQECQGDCDADSQCAGDLVCWQRDTGDPAAVPGCGGTADTNNDYCVRPENEILTVVTRPLYTYPEAGHTDLTICHGDCNHNSDCVGDLICYQRDDDADRQIPGCQGIAERDEDYCVNPYDELTLRDVADNNVLNLQECQGDCDSDLHCDGDLVCFERGSNDVRAIPGCIGTATDMWDYCVDPKRQVPVLVRYPLLECYGDCEYDSDCAGDFKCLHRSVGDPLPPGCFGALFEKTVARDFCYNTSNTLVNVDAQGTDLQMCQGNCASSDACAGYLKCFQREEGGPNPFGCPGRAHSDWNYCYMPGPLVCPDGTKQIGGDNADITGCGILEDCDDKYEIDTVEGCHSQCLLNPYCRSFTFGVPYPLASGANDPDYPDTEECILYNGDVSTDASAKIQKMCAILGGEYERQLCYTSNSVTIGESLNDGIVSDTAISNGLFFFDITTENDDLLTAATDFISIRLHGFKDIDYASYLEFAIYLGKVIVSRVNPSDNTKYELKTVTTAPITASKHYSFWVQFNAEQATDTGFIRFGVGSTNTYSNEILHFPFQAFVEEGDTAQLRTSYEAFKYIVAAYVSADGNTDRTVQMILYDSCKSEDELSAFVNSFGLLSNEKGVSGKVGLNLYVKNNIYSCVIEQVKEGEQNLCTNLQYTKSERCSHDSFRQITHLYDYVMEITYFEDDYLVLDEFYLDDYVISVAETIFVTNKDGNNKVLVAFQDDDDTVNIDGTVVDGSILSQSLDPSEVSFGVTIASKKSTQILIELYGQSNRYSCNFIPSLIEGSLKKLSYSCVSNADNGELDDSRDVYNYVSYTQVDCIPETVDQNQMKIIIESEGDIEIDSVFVNGVEFETFCGDTNEALCSLQSSATTSDTCDRLINCIDIGIASSDKPQIKPIIVFDDIFDTVPSPLNIDSYSNLFKLSITTCNAPKSDTGLSLLLTGILGSSQREILTNLPSNNFNIYHIGSTAVGTFFSLQLEIDGNDSICLSQVILTDAVTDKVLFETDASTIGKGIYLQKECAVPFKVLTDNIFIPCYEQFFLLEAYNSRSYTKLTMELCAGESIEVGLAKENQTAFSVVLTALDKNGLFLTSEAIPLLSDQDWDTTTPTGSFREYNIIYDDFDIVSMSVIFINNDQSDAICIDEVIINSQTAILTNVWIGAQDCADRPCSPSISAVLSWPICKTEIIAETVVLVGKEEATGDVLSSSCENKNRFSSIECAASQSFSYSYSLSEESSVSRADSEGIEIANSYSNGTSLEAGASVTTGAEFAAGALFASASTSLEASASATAGSSSESSRIRTTSEETTIETTETFVADTTTASSISCEGSMELGPYQKVDYKVIKARAISEYQTKTDFKLTKCSYILDANDNNPDHFIYLMNIPGKSEFSETTSCSVEFEETRSIKAQEGSSMTCREAQVIKGSEFDTYVPFCNPINSEQWDPCQCETGDRWTDQTCYCVEARTGVTTPGIKASAIDSSITTWKTWCAQNCVGTQFEADQDLVDINGNVITPSPVSAGGSAIANPQNMVEIIKEMRDIDSKNKYNVISDDKFDEFLLLFGTIGGSFVAVLFCGVVILFVYCIKHLRSSGMNGEKYSKVAQFDFGSATEEV